MFLSQRQSIAQLTTIGIGRRQAWEVLNCGLAGEPVQAAPQFAYRSEVVDQLMARPVVDRQQLLERCPEGRVMVVRRSLGAARHWEGRERALRGGWRMSPYTRGLLRVQVRLVSPIGFLAVVGTFVVFGAELVDVHAGPEETTRLSLRRPRRWYDCLDGVRVEVASRTPWTTLGW